MNLVISGWESRRPPQRRWQSGRLRLAVNQVPRTRWFESITAHVEKKWSKADEKLREAESRPLPKLITNPEQVKLDFSIFHDGFHSLWHCIFPRGCTDCSRAGGWRRHVSDYWEYRGRHRLHRWTWCRIGRHYWTTWYKRDGTTGVDCFACGKPGGSGATPLS